MLSKPGTKSALTREVIKEVADRHIRINRVRPGIIDTNIHNNSDKPGRARKLAPLVPMQRSGPAKQVAAAVHWLLCNQPSYTTGSLLDVTGER